MTDVDALKKAIARLGGDASLDVIVRYAKALQELEALASGEMPEEEEPEEFSAAEEPERLAAPVPPVPAPAPVSAASATSASRSAERVALASDAAMGEAGALVDALVQATGLDEGAVLAALRDSLDAIAAMITGQPPSGAPSAEGDVAPMATAAASRVRADKLEAALAEAMVERERVDARLAAAEEEADMARLELAIMRGHVLPAHRQMLVDLRAASRQAFVDALERAAAEPAVDTSIVANSAAQKPRERKVGESVDLDDDSARRLARALRGAKVPLSRIAERVGRSEDEVQDLLRG